LLFTVTAIYTALKKKKQTKKGEREKTVFTEGGKASRGEGPTEPKMLKEQGENKSTEEEKVRRTMH
jgi:hypothetical protein